MKPACGNPIDFTVLADYWVAALDGPEEQAVEEHLFTCDACGTRLREVIALAEGIRNLARSGALRMVVSDAFLQRAAQDGLRVRQYAPLPGGGVHCTVTEQDDILIGRLAADLSAATTVDLQFLDEKGTELGRMPDVPFHPTAGAVVYQESITFAKGAPDFKLIARLLSRDNTGTETLLGEYTFNHTRSMPGPAAW